MSQLLTLRVPNATIRCRRALPAALRLAVPVLIEIGKNGVASATGASLLKDLNRRADRDSESVRQAVAAL